MAIPDLISLLEVSGRDSDISPDELQYSHGNVNDYEPCILPTVENAVEANLAVSYPLGEKLFSAPPTDEGVVIDVYEACASGICSCVYCHGGVRSQLKPCRFAWIIIREGFDIPHETKLLYSGIVDGFPIVDSPIEPYDCKNYNSALSPENKPLMDAVIEAELNEGFISIAKDTPVCIHSLGAVPKPNGSVRHITDCSRPVGHSVNDSCDDLVLQFTYKSVDSVVALLKKGQFMSVIDIKAAYRAIPIKPSHRPYLGFRWGDGEDEKIFVDNRLCFGLKSGPGFFNLVSELVYEVLTKDCNLTVINYLDDYITINDTLEECVNAQRVMVELLRFLGFSISYRKMTPPSTKTIYLGIEINSETMELSLPRDKLQKLRQLLAKYLGAASIKRKDLESLTGLLAHCSQVIRGGRTFCCRLYDVQKLAILHRLPAVDLPDMVQDDIKWWHSFCATFNGVSAINTDIYPVPMISDSSFKGYGVWLGADWVAGTWNDGDTIDIETPCSHVGPHPVADQIDCHNINVLEMWPIVVGLKRWFHLFRDKTVILYCDNTQVLHILRRSSSRKKNCMFWVRGIFWLCLIYNVSLVPKYISSADNVVADILSRMLYKESARRCTPHLCDLCCYDELSQFCRSIADPTSASSKEP